MRTLTFATLCLVVTGCATSAPTHAQLAPSEQCAAPEFRQLDFWVGEWSVRWDATEDQAAGTGANTVTREYGDCVIQESFQGGPTTGNLIGHSVSTYHAGLGRWRQTWVDNQGGYFALVGGPVDDTFVLETTRLSNTAPHQRMVFENITPTTLTWRWQRSPDGAVWNDSWVIYYERIAR